MSVPDRAFEKKKNIYKRERERERERERMRERGDVD